MKTNWKPRCTDSEDDVSCNDSHAVVSFAVGEKISSYDMLKDKSTKYVQLCQWLKDTRGMLGLSTWYLSFKLA